MAPSESGWTTIYTTYNQVEAQIIAARLSGAGIRTVITGESVRHPTPVSYGIIAELGITVLDEEVDAASRVLIDFGYLEVDEDEE